MHKAHHRIGIALVVAWLIGFSGVAQAANDTVTITFTTTTAAGRYAPRNVHTLYLTDTASRFVTTVGNGTASKRALWGNTRAHDILQWFSSNPTPQPDIDARTGATEQAYKTYTISWIWTKRDGSVVPDGDYKIKFEMTDDNADRNKFNRTEFTITKGRTAWKIGPVTQGGYKDVVIQYTPVVPPKVACDPNAIDFSTQAVGTSVDGSFNLVNEGTAAVTVTSVQITGADKTAFSLVSPPTVPFILVAGGKSAIMVRFSPDSARVYNDAQVDVTATGVTTISPVLLRGQGVVLPPQIEVSTDQLVFPQTNPGGSLIATFSISNTGPGLLHVQSMTLVGSEAEAFTLVGMTDEPLVLLPGALPLQVAVRFTPKTYRTFHAALAIASDDPNRPVVNVTLEGEGGPLVAEILPVLYGLGSRCNTIAMYGTQAVIGQGMVLSVYGVADRDGPYLVSNTVLSGIIEDITMAGDTAYVALGNTGFALVHVEEVNAPTILATVDTDGFCHGVAVVGNRLCAADGQGGLLIYDVSTPVAPSLVGSVPGDIRAVAALGDKAVCLDSQAGLLSIGLNPIEVVGRVSHLQLGQAITISGTTVYVADRLGGFFVVDLTSPTAPQVMGQTQLASPAQALVVTGSTVAAATGSAGMQLIDVSKPSQPVPCTPIPLAGDCTDLAVNDLGVYAVDRQFGLYDFKLPAGCQIAQRRTVSMGMTPLDVAVDGTTAYAAGGSFGLSVWNMTDPLPPKYLGHIEGDVQAVAVSNRTAYLACGTSGLKVRDVFTPTVPHEIGSLEVGGYADTVACEGPVVMLGTGTSVKVLDVSDPCRPSLTATWPAKGQVLDVTVSQGLGLVACGDQGLIILNGNGTAAATLDTPGVAYDVAVSNGITYVADGPAGVQIIDVHNAGAPVLIGTIPTPGPAYAVAVSGNDLFVSGRFGTWKIDITTPASPVIRAISSVPVNGVSLAVSASVVLVADPQAGLLILGR